MTVTRDFVVQLPVEVADALQAEISSGRFTNPSEALTAAYEEHLTVEEEFSTWIREEIVPADKQLDADPSLALTPEELRKRIDSRRAS